MTVERLLPPAPETPLATLQRLYSRESGTTPRPPYYERLRRLLPPTIRSLVDERIQRVIEYELYDAPRDDELGTAQAYVDTRLGDLLPDLVERREIARRIEGMVAAERRRLLPATGDVLPTADALASFLNPLVTRIYMEVATEVVLSTPDQTIENYLCLEAVFSHELEDIAAGRIHPERLDRIGWLFIDVNGMKSIVDGMGHAVGCNFLRRIAALLRNPPEPLAGWLLEQNLEIEGFSVGGDEFFVPVRRHGETLNAKLLEEVAARIREAVANDASLRNDFVAFDSPHFLMEYGGVTVEERHRFEQDNSLRETKLREIRSNLPEVFIPSISTGSALLTDAVKRACTNAWETEVDGSNPVSFDDLTYNIFREGADEADFAQQDWKRQYKEDLERSNPKQALFMRRSAESRRMQQQLERQRGQIQQRDLLIGQQSAEIANLRDEVATLRAQLYGAVNS